MADYVGPESWEDVTAIVLAGGLGTRLRAVVADRPKCLAIVNGRPFLHHQLDRVIASGIRRVVVCTCHLADQVKAAIGNGYGPLEISFSDEITPLGTAGAVRLAAEQLTAPFLLVVNGDSLCHVDWTGLLEAARSVPGQPIMLLAQVTDTERFGRIEWRQTRLGVVVTDFKEKGFCGPGWINAGMYLFLKRDIGELPLGAVISLEREVFPMWVREGRLRGHLLEGDFLDIGTPETYARAGEFVTASPASRPQQVQRWIR